MVLYDEQFVFNLSFLIEDCGVFYLSYISFVKPWCNECKLNCMYLDIPYVIMYVILSCHFGL